jgi:hypothetical protein
VFAAYGSHRCDIRTQFEQFGRNKVLVDCEFSGFVEDIYFVVVATIQCAMVLSVDSDDETGLDTSFVIYLINVFHFYFVNIFKPNEFTVAVGELYQL